MAGLSQSTSPSRLILYLPAVLAHPIHYQPFALRKTNSELLHALDALLSLSPAPSFSLSPDSVIECPDPADLVLLPEVEQSLSTNRSNYDVTTKFFYLPSSLRRQSPRSNQDKSGAIYPPDLPAEALTLFSRATGIPRPDTLIISFPGFSFDDRGPVACDGVGTGMEDRNDEEVDRAMLDVWNALPTDIPRLGISEFSLSRLQRFVALTQSPPTTTTTTTPSSTVTRKPTIDQINLRDCCPIPTDLILYARAEGMELLTHTDCADLLPLATFRALLGKAAAAGRLPEPLRGGGGGGEGRQGGDGVIEGLEPVWALKYSVVIKDRGVVADKGYVVCVERRG